MSNSLTGRLKFSLCTGRSHAWIAHKMQLTVEYNFNIQHRQKRGTAASVLSSYPTNNIEPYLIFQNNKNRLLFQWYWLLLPSKESWEYSLLSFSNQGKNHILWQLQNRLARSCYLVWKREHFGVRRSLSSSSGLTITDKWSQTCSCEMFVTVRLRKQISSKRNTWGVLTVKKWFTYMCVYISRDRLLHLYRNTRTI